MVAFTANYTYAPPTPAPASGSAASGAAALQGGSCIKGQVNAVVQLTETDYRQAAAFMTDVLKSE